MYTCTSGGHPRCPLRPWESHQDSEGPESLLDPRGARRNPSRNAGRAQEWKLLLEGALVTKMPAPSKATFNSGTDSPATEGLIQSQSCKHHAHARQFDCILPKKSTQQQPHNACLSYQVSSSPCYIRVGVNAYIVLDPFVPSTTQPTCDRAHLDGEFWLENNCSTMTLLTRKRAKPPFQASFPELAGPRKHDWPWSF